MLTLHVSLGEDVLDEASDEDGARTRRAWTTRWQRGGASGDGGHFASALTFGLRRMIRYGVA